MFAATTARHSRADSPGNYRTRKCRPIAPGASLRFDAPVMERACAIHRHTGGDQSSSKSSSPDSSSSASSSPPTRSAPFPGGSVGFRCCRCPVAAEEYEIVLAPPQPTVEVNSASASGCSQLRSMPAGGTEGSVFPATCFWMIGIAGHRGDVARRHRVVVSTHNAFRPAVIASSGLGTAATAPTSYIRRAIRKRTGRDAERHTLLTKRGC